MNDIKKTDIKILLGISFGVLAYHLLTAMFAQYGFFIDEFYYIACSKRLAFGYVDHPPLSIFLLAGVRLFFGTSILAVRFLPALASAATVFTTGIITRRLGGSRSAIVLSALASAFMPVYLLMGSFYSMNAFEPLIWTVILYAVLRMVQEQNAKYWLLIGVLFGLGLEMKHTMVLYAVALIAGMALTSPRKLLWNKWFLLGMLSAFVILLPNIFWQIVHGFPSLEFYRNATLNKNIPTSPLMVVVQQIVFANPFLFPLWLAGVLYFIFSPNGKQYRFFSFAYLILLAVLMASGSSRPDRIAAMYTILFSAGALAVTELSRVRLRPYAIIIITILLIVGGGIFLPAVTPLLPPSVTQHYLAALGLHFNLESGKMNERLPQWLADRLGWEELAVDVAHVYYSMPEEERRTTMIISTNYGEAGALELYGARLGLPHVYATHNSYHAWGPPPDSVKTLIAVFVSRRDLETHFDSVETTSVHTCSECTRPQSRIPIYIVRNPRFLFSKEWQSFKIYD